MNFFIQPRPSRRQKKGHPLMRILINSCSLFERWMKTFVRLHWLSWRSFTWNHYPRRSFFSRAFHSTLNRRFQLTPNWILYILTGNQRTIIKPQPASVDSIYPKAPSTSNDAHFQTTRLRNSNQLLLARRCQKKRDVRERWRKEFVIKWKTSIMET